MTPDPQFVWWIVANAIGSFAATVAMLAVAAGTKSISRAFLRWGTSRFPDGPDTDRAKEELEAMVPDMRPWERTALVATVLLNPGRIHRQLNEGALTSAQPNSYTAELGLITALDDMVRRTHGLLEIATDTHRRTVTLIEPIGRTKEPKLTPKGDVEIQLDLSGFPEHYAQNYELSVQLRAMAQRLQEFESAQLLPPEHELRPAVRSLKELLASRALQGERDQEILDMIARAEWKTRAGKIVQLHQKLTPATRPHRPAQPDAGD